MTLEELNQHLALRQELAKDREILMSLETRAVPGAQVLTGMPHAPGVVAKVEIFAVEIADYKAHIEELEAEIAEQEKSIEAWLKTVPPTMRLIFRLRYIHALQWKEVAYMLGGTNSEQSVTSACYRYLAQMQDDAEYN